MPQITTEDNETLQAIHKAKKKEYKNYLDKAVLNTGLVDIVRLMHAEYKTAVVKFKMKTKRKMIGQLNVTDLKMKILLE